MPTGPLITANKVPQSGCEFHCSDSAAAKNDEFYRYVIPVYIDTVVACYYYPTTFQYESCYKAKKRRLKISLLPKLQE